MKFSPYGMFHPSSFLRGKFRPEILRGPPSVGVKQGRGG